MARRALRVRPSNFIGFDGKLLAELNPAFGRFERIRQIADAPLECFRIASETVGPPCMDPNSIESTGFTLWIGINRVLNAVKDG